MDPASVIVLGTEVGKVINNIFAQLSPKDQKIMMEFFKFTDRCTEELAREDADHDDLLLWKERKEKLIETVMSQLKFKEGGK